MLNACQAASLLSSRPKDARSGPEFSESKACATAGCVWSASGRHRHRRGEGIATVFLGEAFQGSLCTLNRLQGATTWNRLLKSILIMIIQS